MNAKTAGRLYGCAEHNLNAGEFVRMKSASDTLHAADTRGRRKLAAVLYVMHETLGRQDEPQARHLRACALSPDWTPHMSEVCDLAAGCVLGRSKEAGMASAVGGTLAKSTNIGMNALKLLAGAALVTGGGLGAAYWYAKRQARHPNDRTLRMEQRRDYYNSLANDLNSALGSRYGYTVEAGDDR